MNSLTFALVQAHLAWQEPAKNRAHLESLIRSFDENADVFVLPETFTTGFLGDVSEPAETMSGNTLSWMKELAIERAAAICGSVAIEDDGRRNRFLWVSPDGSVQYYDKKHLFGFGGEDQRYAAGEERRIIQYRGWRICPQICYDLRFPVWCRNRNDYDLMLLVANWPSARVAAWDTLLRARAIENQSFVVAVNRVGQDGNGHEYPGHSVVLDPLGEQLAFAGSEEACVSTNVDLEFVEKIRAKLPFQADADDFVLVH